VSERIEPADPRAAAFGVFLWAIVLLFGTLRPAFEVSEPFFPMADKLAHGLGWFILGIPASAMAQTHVGRLRAFVACLAFGLLTELGQVLVPGRSFELLDLVADGVGAALGIAVVGSRRLPVDD